MQRLESHGNFKPIPDATFSDITPDGLLECFRVS